MRTFGLSHQFKGPATVKLAILQLKQVLATFTVRDAVICIPLPACLCPGLVSCVLCLGVGAAVHCSALSRLRLMSSSRETMQGSYSAVHTTHLAPVSFTKLSNSVL